MALMERVATLLRANISDLIDRAEDPEKMLKQLVLDMENQLLQVKTQVAIALADQYLLGKRMREQEDIVANWHRKAQLAVGEGDDTLARIALERALGQESILAAFRAQAADGMAEAEAVRSTYAKLQGKMAETRARCELLLAQYRRARLVRRAVEAHAAVEEAALRPTRFLAVDRLQRQTGVSGTETRADKSLLPSSSLEDRLGQLETDDRVERLLADLKTRQSGSFTLG